VAGKSVERKLLATDRDGTAKRNEAIDPFDDNAGRFARMQLLGWSEDSENCDYLHSTPAAGLPKGESSAAVFRLVSQLTREAGL
jgi:hypothetical protein